MSASRRQLAFQNTATCRSAAGGRYIVTANRLLRVDHYTPAAERRGRRGVVVGVGLVVVDDGARGCLPDLDPEAVLTAAALRLAVDRGEEEAVGTRAVHGAGALVDPLRLARDDEPLIARALEVEATGVKLELGVAGGRGGA